MIDHRQRGHNSPDQVTVKLVGPQGLVQLLAENIERNFYAFRTSEYRKNDADSGVHIFLKVAGVRT